ncbi:hypothetical protein PENTCL1PPCAC_17466, partial [Pristionchus entomophagus]
IDELRPEETRNVQVNSNGLAEYRFTLILGCVCKLELDDYPFDTQLCSSQFYVYQHKLKTLIVRGRANSNITVVDNDVWMIRNINTTEPPIMYNSPFYGRTELNMIGIGIGVLTAMTLILTIVADSVPRKKEISVLATFIIANIFVLAVATVVIVINPCKKIGGFLMGIFPRQHTKPISIILESDQPQKK